MRLLPLAMALVFMLVSGCLSEERTDDPPATGEGDGADDRDSNGDGIPDTGEDTDGDGIPEPLPPVPDPIVFTGELQGVGYQGFLPVGPPVDPVPACALGAQQCTDHVVTIPPGSWQVTFTLVGSNGMVTDAGDVQGTDYDLFVEGVGDSTNAAGEDDTVAKRLDAGDYTAQVLAWHDVDGSYTLTVTFAY